MNYGESSKRAMLDVTSSPSFLCLGESIEVEICGSINLHSMYVSIHLTYIDYPATGI